MSTNKFLLFISSVLILSSCSLSKTFHRPSPIPVSIEKVPSFGSGKDTTFLDFDSKTQQIKFFKKDSILINKNFSITSANFESKSGNKLNTWILKPRYRKVKATIVHFHGSAGNLLSQYQAISPLIDYGFQIITFDYSGYGFSEGKASRENILKDAFSFLDFAKEHEQIIDSKLILYGQSYGGYLAAVVGSNKQDDIDGIVIEGAFSSHKAEANYTLPILGLIVKNEDRAAVEIRKNNKPVLIIHSSEDKKVPIKFGKKIFENANQPKEFYEIDRPHIFGLQYYPEEISEKIKMMLEK
jgi:pimeloyl-ACP methyl ester carboxylesterase